MRAHFYIPKRHNYRNPLLPIVRKHPEAGPEVRDTPLKTFCNSAPGVALVHKHLTSHSGIHFGRLFCDHGHVGGRASIPELDPQTDRGSGRIHVRIRRKSENPVGSINFGLASEKISFRFFAPLKELERSKCK